MKKETKANRRKGAAGHVGADRQMQWSLGVASRWQMLAGIFMVLVIPWALYINFHPRFRTQSDAREAFNEFGFILETGESQSDALVEAESKKLMSDISMRSTTATSPEGSRALNFSQSSLPIAVAPASAVSMQVVDAEMPVLGPVPTDGASPLYGIKHTGGDAIFALACNYPKQFYQRFVGSLRKVGYQGDIVLAVSPPAKMKPNVEKYIKQMNVVAYGFDVDCKGKDNCRLLDEFLGYPDPRPYRTFANIRYALYEYWLRHYTPQSYILILDFRDTFFQADPFASFGPVASRTPKYELQLFAENHKVKNIGKCVYNSLWIGRCFGKPALKALSHHPVLCSGSTLGTFQSIRFYVRTMLSSMDSVKCWLKGIESDQGYQNYLYYNGFFNVNGVNATVFEQGTGIVNTIGALNGKRYVNQRQLMFFQRDGLLLKFILFSLKPPSRVPSASKGPLDTFWHARDAEGYVVNYDGTRSACVHQWDRWYKDLRKFIDTKLY